MGYSRRLSRPNSWNLNPFRERTSETSYYTGNPFLKPSYSDNFDFGYIKQFNKVTISGSLYLNQNYGAFDRVTIETGEYTLVNGLSTPIVRRSPINLSKEERFGFELNNSFKWNTNWRSNISLNYYKQFKRGTYDEISYDSENKSWSGNFRNSLLFPGKINTQLNVRFRGPRKSAYSEVKSSISADFTMNKDFLNDRATVSLSFSDLFNSREYRYKTLKQWKLRVSSYAQRLLNGLEEIDWPEPLKEMQKNWIGQSHGARVKFKIKGSKNLIEVFTTRPDTIYGVTFLTLAPEHKLVKDLTTKSNLGNVSRYISKIAKKNEK